MGPGDRIKERLEALNLSQAELARRVGITQPSINHLIRKGAGGSAHLHKIARVLETTPEYLTGETDDPGASGVRDERPVYIAMPTPEAETDDVEIDFIDLSYGMGGTFLDVGDAEVEKVKLPRTLLRRITPMSHESLGAAEGVGDSMEPVIFDRDLVFFDRSARLEEHISDKMWVFAYGQIGMIKRLRPLPDGTVKLMSANRTYPDEIATGDELHIIGRVVGTLRRH